MHAKLLCLDTIFPLAEIRLSSFPTVIGRGENVKIRIEDRWVSRRHCEIDRVDGVLVVRDLGSKHGTFVNGYPVSESPLSPGDHLHIGLYKFEAQYDFSDGELTESGLASGESTSTVRGGGRPTLTLGS